MNGYMKEPRQECRNPSRCKYLHVVDMFDYCTCEDEMCAGCIPTYEGK